MWHQLNDRAVMETYGFWRKLNSESECVAELMGMYRKMTDITYDYPHALFTYIFA